MDENSWVAVLWLAGEDWAGSWAGNEWMDEWQDGQAGSRVRVHESVCGQVFE